MKNYILPMIVAVALIGCNTMAQDQEKTELPATGETSLKKEVSYALGVSIGENLKNGGFGELNYEELAKGIKEVTEGVATTTAQESQQLITQYQKEMKGKLAEDNLIEANEFLEKNKTKEGVITTDSGFQYKVLTEGTGATPAATDKVTLHYTGTLVDGTKFDSSRDRGTPTTLGANQFIKGFTEGLLLMKEGAVYEFYIHPDLGYGLNPRPGVIQPNDALVFNVELISVN
ncbi:MAG: FKBP-type peptidyl-prolyl cis-trans isomerase [Flavobacteriales bacterium]